MSIERVELRFSGSGGQGVVLAGEILGRAFAYAGLNVAQTQSYGAEARGSKAKSEVIASSSPIGFPMVRRCDIMVAMNQGGVDSYIGDLKEDGILLVDEDLVKNIPETPKASIIKIRANGLAKEKLGANMFANMIMVGAVVKILEKTMKLDFNIVERAVKDSTPEKLVEQNLEALRIGYSTVK